MNAEQLLQHFERISEAPDAIKRLRRFILDLAVRGKLVEQDPSDEPASELLKRIAAEKARLVKEGLGASRSRKNNKDAAIPYSEKDLEIPSSWTWARLLELGHTQTGTSPSSANPGLFGDEIPFIKPGDLDGKEIIYDGPGLSLEGVKQSRLAPSNTLLMVCIGATLGKVNKTTRPVCFNQQINSLIPLMGAFTDYLALALKSSCFQQLAWSKAGTGTLPIISKGKWEVLPIPLPPLAEQHRIVAKVDELMSLCDQLEAAKAEREKCRDSLVAASLQGLNQPAEEEDTFREHARFTFNNLPRITTRPTHIKQLRQTILNLALRGKLVEQDPSDEPAEEQLARIMEAKMLHGRKAKATKRKHAAALDEEDDFHLPTSWATAPLADLVTVLNGRAYKQSELLDAGTPVLRVGNLFTSNKWYYSDLELDNDKYCDDGDLIFSWSASFGPFIWNGGRTIYHYHIWKLPLHSPDDLSRDYLYLYLLDKTAEIKAAGHGISMVHMTKEKMEKLEVPLPPLAEQQRIVAKVNELMAICDQLEAQITATEQDSRRFLESVLADALAPGIELREVAEVA